MYLFIIYTRTRVYMYYTIYIVRVRVAYSIILCTVQQVYIVAVVRGKRTDQPLPCCVSKKSFPLYSIQKRRVSGVNFVVVLRAERLPCLSFLILFPPPFQRLPCCVYLCRTFFLSIQILFFPLERKVVRISEYLRQTFPEEFLNINAVIPGD